MLPPSLQTIDEVRLVMNLQLCFCTTPPARTPASPTRGSPLSLLLPPWSSLCWLVTHSALVQQLRLLLLEKSYFPPCYKLSS